MIDADMREALTQRAKRGKDSGADEIWERTLAQFPDGKINPVPFDVDLDDSTAVEPSRTGWLAAVASFLLVIAGAALIATGLIGQNSPPASQPDEIVERDEGVEEVVDGPEIILHFAGQRVQRWQPLINTPDAFVVETALGADEFTILYYVGQAADITTISGNVAPTLACDAANSCVIESGGVLSDQDVTLEQFDTPLRLVERPGDTIRGAETTATFLWDSQDVVQVVGTCAPGCVRQALGQLREGTEADLDVEPGSQEDPNRTPGRIFVGVLMILLGLIRLFTIRVAKPSSGNRSLSNGWIGIQRTPEEWREIEQLRKRRSSDRD